MPIGWAAGAAAVGSIAAGAIGAAGAESAAHTQAGYEEQALGQQQSMFNTEQSNESPFIQAGGQAQGQLNYLMGIGGQTNPDGTPKSNAGGAYGSLNTPFNMDTFKSLSPQYGFNLQQGGQGTLNQDSNAQGAESGAALKDLMSFNQNYANNSFNSAFGNYQTQQNNIFNRLNSIATLGANAGSNSATGASQFSNSIGNTTSSIGASLASGTVGAANAIGGGIGGAANAFYGQNALNQILSQGSTIPYQSPTGGTSGTTGDYSWTVPNSQ